MNRPPDPSRPPDAAAESGESRPTVLLFMRESRDRELLAETLAESSAVEATTDPDRLADPFDCCVFDLGRFEAVEQHVGARSEEAPEGPFEPCVMLVSDRELEALSADHWRVVDDVIALPTHREAILARVENLIERRRASLALAEERSALERQNEHLETFASVVSHDLRNPLSVAEGYVELGREDGEPELEVIYRALGRMREIIDDLLTLARDETDPSAFEPVELRSFLEECWQAVDTPEASLRVETAATIRGHRSRLGNLFENLFRNAVDHGGTGVTVEVGDLDGGLYVEDDGPGIPADARAAVLESGYSMDDGGTGLGLAIVREIAEEHGWTVTVTEGAAGGARFEFAGVEPAGA